MIDLSMLTEPGKKFCVRCYDVESCVAFLEEMIKQHPEKCRFWSHGENRWRDRIGEYVDYFPYLNNVDGDRLLWDSDGYAEDNGYFIIDYDELPGARGELPDFGEIDLSGVDIGALF